MLIKQKNNKFKSKCFIDVMSGKKLNIESALNTVTHVLFKPLKRIKT